MTSRRKCSNCGEDLCFTEHNPCDNCSAKPFTPDWNLPEAAAESLREHMVIAKSAQESERAFREQVAAALRELRERVARLPVPDYTTDGEADELVRLKTVLGLINVTANNLTEDAPDETCGTMEER